MSLSSINSNRSADFQAALNPDQFKEQFKRARQIFGFLILMAIATLIWPAISAWRGCRAFSWPTTIGTFIDCHLQQSTRTSGENGSQQVWEVQVVYHYKVAGTEYENDRVGF